MPPEDKNLVLALVDLIDSFGALRRKRDAFIHAMGTDPDPARIMELAMAAGDEMATRELFRGGPGMDVAKLDVEKFRSKAVMAALEATDDLRLRFRMPPPSTDVGPTATPPGPPPRHKVTLGSSSAH
jgi:hypothetical protein